MANFSENFANFVNFTSNLGNFTSNFVDFTSNFVNFTSDFVDFTSNLADFTKNFVDFINDSADFTIRGVNLADFKCCFADTHLLRPTRTYWIVQVIMLDYYCFELNFTESDFVNFQKCYLIDCCFARKCC